jgi:hypothetical protein
VLSGGDLSVVCGVCCQVEACVLCVVRWMSVCCVCYVFSGGGPCVGLITHPEESYPVWRVVVCDIETS